MKMTPDQRKFYQYVLDLALNAKPCPLKAVMAEQLGFKEYQVSHAMRELRAANVIEIDIINRGWSKGCNRVIRIVALDIETAGNHDEHDLNSPPPGHIFEVKSEQDQAREACDTLLRRQLETGAHWIRDPAQFRVVCESVGLAVA